MRVESPRFGPLELDEGRILRFERGLPGFPGCTRFAVLEHDRDTPLKWLLCIDRPEIAFLVVEPEQILADYRLEVPAAVLEALGWKEQDPPSAIAAFLILNVEGGELTANLRAPVVVNVEQRRAQQLILDDPALPLRYAVRPPAA